MRKGFLAALLFASLFGADVRAESTFPMISSISPVAVEIGKSSDCIVTARYSLEGAYRVFVSGEGVTGEALGLETIPSPAKKGQKAPPPKFRIDRLRVRFTVASHAFPGVRDVRVATPRGVSTLGQLVLVRDPIIREKANNDTMATAQPVTWPATICGAIEKPEDVDFYRFNVETGTTLTFHVRSQRLEDKIHDLQDHCDPLLTLRNTQGTVIASNDNYFAGDPLLSYAFTRGGDYYLEIRDSRYGGSPSWLYTIDINDRPFVTNVYPSRVVPGVTTHLQLIGFHLPPEPFTELMLPANTPDGVQWVELPLGPGRFSNPVPIIVSRLPEVRETVGEHATPETAQPITVPAGICGRIEHENEVDCYAFEAKKGEHFTFEVKARPYQSALDSNLRVLNAKGRRLAENDDAPGRFVSADSLIENWTAPASGTFTVEIRDLHQRGGPEFVYFLAVTHAEPSFTLEADSDKTLLSPGVSGVIFVRVNRRNGFKGAVPLAVDDLPSGVSAACGSILPDGKDGCIMLHAAAEAPQEAANIRVSGTAVLDDGTRLTVPATPLQEVSTMGGGRLHVRTEMHTVSVGAPLDIRGVTISPTEISLKPGETKRIEVTILRAPEFKGGVTLTPIYAHGGAVFGNTLPAGVTVDERSSRTRLAGDQTKGWIILKAAANAEPAEKQQVALMALVPINFVVRYTYAGQPLLLSVTKP